MLVGEPGAGVHLSLSQGGPNANDPMPQDALPQLQMSLDLAPEEQPQVRNGELCFGFNLSMDVGVNHRGAVHAGRISLPLGETRAVELFGGGERLHLELTVARAGSKAYDTLLRKRRARPLT